MTEHLQQLENIKKSNREIKASAFTAYFSDPKNAAALYQALEALSEKPWEEISPKLIEPEALYRSRLISIPTPEFYVFYNGADSLPAEKNLKLSDAYLEQTGEPMLELTVKVININLPMEHPILKSCRSLYEYSWFIQKIKDYQGKGLHRDEAILLAMKDCSRKGVMADFLKEHGTEAVNMLFTQFNMEDAKRIWREEAREDGLEEGRQKGRQETKRSIIRNLLRRGMSEADICAVVECSPELVAEVKKGAAV